MSFMIAGAAIGAFAGVGTVGILAGAALGAVGGSMIGGAVDAKKNGEKALDAQKAANVQAQIDADKLLTAQSESAAQASAQASAQAKAADQRFNAANQKRPDTRSMLDAASAAGRGGVSGTMLTGASGVDKNAMALGKSTLLGM